MLEFRLGYSPLYRNFYKYLYIELYHLFNPVRFNFASKSAALRSAALRFLVSSCMDVFKDSTRESISSSLDKHSASFFRYSRKSCKTRFIARFSKSNSRRRSTRVLICCCRSSDAIRLNFRKFRS